MRDLVHFAPARAPGTAAAAVAPADALLASFGAKLLATAARVALGVNAIPTPPCIFP